jgi:hypothetical protein
VRVEWPRFPSPTTHLSHSRRPWPHPSPLPFSQIIDTLVTNKTSLYYSLSLQLNSHAAADGGSPDLWWTVSFGSQLPSPVDNSSGAGLVFNTVSDRIAPSFITSSFASYGVVAIYVTVRGTARH